MPVVQKFKRFVDDKRCKVPFFLYLWLTYRARGLWGGVLQSPSPSHLLDSPRPGWPTVPGGARPPFSLRRARLESAMRRLPAAVGRASSGPPHSSHSVLLSLLGQKLGPRGGSSCGLGRRPRPLQGRVMTGSREGWAGSWRGGPDGPGLPA